MNITEAPDSDLCEVDGCDSESRVLLADGSLCASHAHEVAPDVTAYLGWAAQCLEQEDSE